jgi:hypothetical protein
MVDDRERPDGNADQRAEHEFDVIACVLAGALTLIVVAAIGYGILRSSEVASTIPTPRSSDITPGAVTPATTDGSGAAHRKPSRSP